MNTSNQTPSSHIEWFRNAAPYIKTHRGKTFVILYDTALLSSEEKLTCAYDITLLASLDINLVILFDDTSTTNKDQIHNQTFDILSLLSMGLAHSPMKKAEIKAITGNFISAQPMGIIQGQDQGEKGKIRNIKAKEIKAQLTQNNIVLIPPVGFSPTGSEYYLPTDELAPQLAHQIKADKLICITQAPISKKLPNHMTLSTCDQYLKKADKTLKHWLNIAKLACDLDIPRTHLIQHQQGNELLKELFTNQGAGTLITKTPYPHIRQAQSADIGGILTLIKPLEQQGTLVARTKQYLETAINEFAVVELDGLILGCAALHPYPQHKIGELACLAVDPNHQKQHWGAELLNHIETQATNQGLSDLIVLTTQAEDWFKQQGFHITKLESLPLERQLLYNYQRQSKILQKKLT